MVEVDALEAAEHMPYCEVMDRALAVERGDNASAIRLGVYPSGWEGRHRLEDNHVEGSHEDEWRGEGIPEAGTCADMAAHRSLANE